MKTFITSVKSEFLFEYAFNRTLADRLIENSCELDLYLINVAKDSLEHHEYLIFYYLYHCVPTIGGIQRKYRAIKGKKLSQSSLHTYISRIKTKMIQGAKESEEIKKWLTNLES